MTNAKKYLPLAALFSFIFFFFSGPRSAISKTEQNSQQSANGSTGQMLISQELSLQLNTSSLNSMISTNELLNLLDLQDQSLENLETQWTLLQEQLKRLEISNRELELQLSSSLKTTKNLQLSLTEAQNNYNELNEYQQDLLKRLSEQNRRYRAASIAGPIAGFLTAAGIGLIIYGAVDKNDPLLYTGIGLSGATIVVWTTGKLAFEWW